MYHEFFTKSPLLAFPIVALVIFVAVFGLIVLRTLSKRERESAGVASLLPLEDDAAPPAAPARIGSTRSEGRHE